MYRKPIPSDKEIDAQAKRFRSLWKSDQAIRPYLRRHAQLFHDLLKEDWSWASLALALTKAGITYQTKKPWSASSLMQAFSRAQSPLKGYTRGRSTRASASIQLPSPPNTSETAAEVVTFQAAVAGQAPAERPRPRFKPVSIKPPEPRHHQTAEELAELEQNRILTFGRP